MQKTSKFKRAIAFVALSAAAASAAALPTTPGNLLVSDLDAGVLNEYTRSGSLVQQFNIPAAGGYWHDLRDVVQRLLVVPNKRPGAAVELGRIGYLQHRLEAEAEPADLIAALL